MLQTVEDVLKKSEQRFLNTGIGVTLCTDPFLVVTTHPRVTLRPYPQVHARCAVSLERFLSTG